MAAPAPPLSPPRRVAGLVLFALAGLAGNALPLSVGFNVDFIFGSIAGLCAVAALGPVPGVAASTIAAAYTFALWRHPYAIVIFGCEAAFVAVSRRYRPRTPVALLDLAYWLLLGAPLVFAFYFGAMNLGLRSTAIIALKQALNGVSNAVLASVVLNLVPLERWAGRGDRPPPRTSRLFFEYAAFLVLVVGVGALTYVNRREIEGSQTTLALRVQRAGAEGDWLITGWLDHHRRAVMEVAKKGAEAGLRRDPRLQQQLEALHRLFPEFHNLLVADRRAVTVAFDPPVNARGDSTLGLDYSDRAWFRRLQVERRAIVSDVFPGRGGVFQPIAVIVAPVLEGGESEEDGQLVGLGLGSINLANLEKLLQEIAAAGGLTLTLVDRQGAIVTSTDRARRPLEAFALAAIPDEDDPVPGVHLHRPAGQRNVSVMRDWRDAVFFTRHPLESTGWTLVVEAPLAPLQQGVYDRTIVNLAGILALMLVASGLALWLGEQLSRPLGALAAISAGLPERIESDATVAWPSPATAEVASLTENFRVTEAALRGKVHSLKAHGEGLERIVAERTAKIDAYAQSQRVLLGEVNHRVKNNLALIVSMLRMERRSNRDAPGKGLLDDIERRVDALGRVHSMLSSTEWRPLRLRELCDRIVTGALGQAQVTIRCTPAEVLIAAAQAHSLALVLNELATNTEKHAGPGPIAVELEITERDGRVQLVYRDGGPGYPEPVLRGELSERSTGIRLIRGTVGMSLRGEVTFRNAGGAVADVTYASSRPEERLHDGA
ncbi:MAG: HWE histidine kinase domain-containing protein [Anaeromyxobacteraceae bacterium]